MNENENFIDFDLEAAGEIFRMDKQCGLGADAIVSALRAMKENPSLTVEEAIQIGILEWYK